MNKQMTNACKLVIVGLIVIVFDVTITAQSFIKELSYGVEVGITSTTFHHETISYHTNVGQAVGITTIYDLNSHINIKSGVMYLDKNSTNNDDNIEWKCTYLEVPVNIYYRLPNQFKWLDIELTMGGYISDLIDAQKNKQSGFDEIADFDVGLRFGSSIQLLSFGKWVKEIRFDLLYDVGFSNVLEQTKSSTILTTFHTHF